MRTDLPLVILVNVSNLMFSLFQFGIAQKVAIDPALILALQCVGASAGSIICISNVVAAAANVGLIGQEGLVIHKGMPPTIYYLVFAGILGGSDPAIYTNSPLDKILKRSQIFGILSINNLGDRIGTI